MRIQLFADAICLGWIEARIIDESMGVVGGILNPSAVYLAEFQPFFRAYLQKSDWERLKALELSAVTEQQVKLECAGGSCFADIEEFAEIEVEICGLDYRQLKNDFRCIT